MGNSWKTVHQYLGLSLHARTISLCLRGHDSVTMTGSSGGLNASSCQTLLQFFYRQTCVVIQLPLKLCVCSLHRTQAKLPATKYTFHSGPRTWDTKPLERPFETEIRSPSYPNFTSGRHPTRKKKAAVFPASHKCLLPDPRKRLRPVLISALGSAL